MKSSQGFWEYGAELPGLWKVAMGTVAWALLLACWEWLPRPERLELLVPPFSKVLATLWHLFGDQGFLADVGASLVRILTSFLLALAIAWPLGVAMGVFPAAEAFLFPLISPLRYLPAASFIPLLLALLGTGDSQKIALLVLGVVWFLASLFGDDTRRVPREWIEAARTLGAGRLRTVCAVIIPACLPSYLDTTRQMLAVSWTYLVIAEIIASTDGIGAVMMRARRLLRMDVIVACIVTIGVLGFLSDLLLRGLRWAAFPYLRPPKR